MTELLGHLHFPLSLLEHSICRPSMLPMITSQFLTRGPGDRPTVLEEDRPNLAFLGQYVEIPEDTVFTVEYSVRAGALSDSCLFLFPDTTSPFKQHKWLSMASWGLTRHQNLSTKENIISLFSLTLCKPCSRRDGYKIRTELIWTLHTSYPASENVEKD